MVFDGKCYNCGDEGHLTLDYNKPRKDGVNKISGQPSRKGGKFKGTCNNCVKYGHKKTDCWELDKNSEKAKRIQR